MSGGLTAPVLQVPPAQYEENLRTLVKRLQATGAKLIWASTTPVPDSTALRPLRQEADVVKYNEIAARVMAENKIPTDDLYNAVLPQEAQLQVKNNVHWTKPGYQLLAQHVDRFDQGSPRDAQGAIVSEHADISRNSIHTVNRKYSTAALLAAVFFSSSAFAIETDSTKLELASPKNDDHFEVDQTVVLLEIERSSKL